MKTIIKVLLVVVVFIVIWRVIYAVTIKGMSQTMGWTVPSNVSLCREVARYLMLPWDWLPGICFTWGRSGMEVERPIANTLGLLWTSVVAAGLSLVFYLRRRRA